MKKIFIFSCLLCFLSCHSNNGKGSLADISILPSFDMLLIDGTTLLHTKDIRADKPIMLIYFRPDCPICQAEIKNLSHNMDSLKDINIYMVSGADLWDIKGFYHYYQLDHYQNITIGKDAREPSFFRTFKPTSIPYIAIYDQEKKLTKIYAGEIPIHSLITAIHN